MIRHQRLTICDVQTHRLQLQHHLYAPLGPRRENLQPYQRTAHDFFISENLRQELQRKAEATLQVLSSKQVPELIHFNCKLILNKDTTLPSTLEHFHSLVPLDTSNQRSSIAFGYNSWIYKAVSSKDGQIYALRRLEGKEHSMLPPVILHMLNDLD